MQCPDNVLDQTSHALLLASEADDGRLRFEWASAALSALTETSGTAVYAQRVFEALERLRSEGPLATFVVPRVDTRGTMHLDSVSGRWFDAEATRYWVAHVEDTQTTVSAAEERDQLLRRVAAGTAAVQTILRVTDVMRAEVTVPNAVAAVPSLLVPGMAQWATVQVLTPEGDAWAACATAHEEGAFPAGFQRYVGPLVPAQLRQSSHYAVLTGRRPFLLEAPVSDHGLDVAVPSGPAKVLRGMSIGEALTVPVLAGETVIGTILLVRGRGGPGFTQRDIEMARLLGRRVGNALRVIERTEARRLKAVTVQNALLPELPSIPGVETVFAYRPSASYASVGGDWFDALALGGGDLGLSIGDVCGHDTGSMAAMAAYRWTIHTHLWQGCDPAAALDLLDEQLGSGPDLPLLATAVVARVERTDPHRFRLSYTTAGHLPAVVIAADGRVTVLDGAAATPIGIRPTTGSRPVRSGEFPYGSTLVMFTDGVVERRDVPLEARIDELHAALRSVGGSAPIEEIRDVLFQLNDDLRLEDDMTFVIARIGPPPVPAGITPARGVVSR